MVDPVAGLGLALKGVEFIKGQSSKQRQLLLRFHGSVSNYWLPDGDDNRQRPESVVYAHVALTATAVGDQCVHESAALIYSRRSVPCAARLTSFDERGWQSTARLLQGQGLVAELERLAKGSPHTTSAVEIKDGQSREIHVQGWGVSSADAGIRDHREYLHLALRWHVDSSLMLCLVRLPPPSTQRGASFLEWSWSLNGRSDDELAGALAEAPIEEGAQWKDAI